PPPLPRRSSDLAPHRPLTTAARRIEASPPKIRKLGIVGRVANAGGGEPLRSTACLRPPRASRPSPLASSTDSSMRFAAASVSSCERSGRDRKSTRLNSSHVKISYAVFCLKKKNKK